MIDLPCFHQLFTGDSIEMMSQLPSNYVDLIFADPPYFMQLQDDLWRPDQTKVAAVDDEWDQFLSFADYDRFTRSWLTEAKRMMKDTATIFVMGSYHNIFRVGNVLQDLGFWVLNDIVWEKANPTPQMKGTRFCNAHEHLIWASKFKGAKYTFNYKELKAANEDKQMRSVWSLPICSGGERLVDENGKKAHSTQKPESLLRRVILSASKRGDLILDPFLGSGTTGAVAKKLGRNFIGIDLEPRYVKLSQDRLDAVEEEPLDDFVKGTLIGSKPAKRVPFLTLIEIGKLKTGDQLRLYRSPTQPTEHVANVHEDGTVSVGDERGSIHQVGKLLLELPSCNGWVHWHYLRDGVAWPIDMLRIQVLAEEVTSC